MRGANPDDATVVEDYHHRCFTSTYAAQLRAGDFDVPDREGTRQQLESWFQPQSGLETQIALLDDVRVAHFTVGGHQLVHLFVDPDHQRVGLGRHLLARAEASIAASGHTEFELHARVENVAAIAFYEKAGWTVTDRMIRTVEHGISYDERVLIKRP